ncbi:MAG: PTS sugar transporter subunit IIA, partial [Aerococcaceae bacterium]|nr:PTS sugar transporter subunit IIA [Aerococcaceae bacterium]
GNFFNIPVVYVTVLVNQSDIEKIRYTLKRLTKSHSTVVEKKEEVTRNKDIINHYLVEERCLYYTEKVTKTRVIEDLLATLSQSNDTEFIDEMRRQVSVREMLGSIIFSEYFAFPHPAKPQGIITEVAFAICPSGVEWDERHKDIRFVMLISPSRFDNKELPILMEFFADLLQDEQKIQVLLDNPSITTLQNLY